MIRKYSYNEKDLGTKQVLPGVLGKDKKVNLKRFVTAKDLSYRAGYLRMEKNKSFESFYWYDEFWCVLEGEGKVNTIHRASGKATEWKLKAKDLFFISKGEWIQARALSEEPFIFFYCAIPAASKDASWLVHVTKEDVNDVRKREEF